MIPMKKESIDHNVQQALRLDHDLHDKMFCLFMDMVLVVMAYMGILEEVGGRGWFFGLEKAEGVGI